MRKLCIAIFVLSQTACAGSFEKPKNLSSMNGNGYLAERQSMSGKRDDSRSPQASAQNLTSCQDMDLAPTHQPVDVALGSAFEEPTRLSPGDLIRIEIARGKGFEGDYVITPDGYIRLPYIGDVPAAGTTLQEVENTVARLLVSGGFFKSNFVQASTSVLQWAPVQVSVSGAVFQSGDVLLNQKQADSDPSARIEALGDFTLQRRLSAALFASAGVRPDADVRNVVVIRNGRRQVYNMMGALDGSPIDDPLLVAGDRVHVPSRGCFQHALARPSRITPPGIRVFMSNLTRPSTSNANSAIGSHATQLPYGSRLLQGLVSANCVGGIQATNARRWGVLISRNPITGESEVVARSIEDLVRRADRDDFNPVLLPNDAIACYDSHVTNVRDIIALFSEAAAPIINASVLGGVVK